MAYEGIQIDMEQKKIRTYKKYLGRYFGDWFNLSEFKSIELRHEKVVQEESRSTIYIVRLIGSEQGSVMELGRFYSHKPAQNFMAKYAQLLDFPSRDFLAEMRAHGRQKRRERDDKADRDYRAGIR